jgi:sulfate adenylyltransferase
MRPPHQVRPHGGTLVNRVLVGNAEEPGIRHHPPLPTLPLSEEQAHEVWNLAHGVYSPLEGFMERETFESVLDTMRLPSGLPWTIPIVLSLTEDECRRLHGKDEILLTYTGQPLSILHTEGPYRFDRAAYAHQVFGTTDAAHPGVAAVLGLDPYLIGGPVDLISEPPDLFARYKLTPTETRVLFAAKGWRQIVGFQTRNVPHLGHEYVQKTALTFVDGLFVNPVIGRKKDGDFRDDVILEAYNVLMKHYYLRERAVLAILRTEMRYAGPREAVFHAIVRKNFGCTHFAVGRDHAGVGKYYMPYASQEIFQQFPDLGIIPVFFTAFYYCKRCQSVVNEKTCPHGGEDRIDFSASRVRQALREGVAPPPELLRSEVAEVLLRQHKVFVEHSS